MRARPPDLRGAVRTHVRPGRARPHEDASVVEALLRRVRQVGALPRISAMVDVCNWCSLEFQLPCRLYDRAAIEGDVELRLGRRGESYPGIRKDDVHVAGRLALADARGPFGSPTSDSARTMVTPATTDGAGRHLRARRHGYRRTCARCSMRLWRGWPSSPGAVKTGALGA